MDPPTPHSFASLLKLVNDKYEAPPDKVVKRMRVDGSSSSLLKYVVRVVEKGETAELEDDTEEDMCENCNILKIFDPKTAQAVCTSCGETASYMVPDTGFREGVQFHTPYLYKRANHFRDHLKRVQGKESTAIEPEVIQSIQREIAKTMTPLEKISPSDVRAILKRLGLSKLYNHTVRIWALSTGGMPPQLTMTQEQELIHLFAMIQDPWNRSKPANRSNMLSYSYLIHKMAKLLGYHDLATHFKLLKSKEKLQFQDAVWKKVCKELGLRFESSV